MILIHDYNRKPLYHLFKEWWKKRGKTNLNYFYTEQKKNFVLIKILEQMVILAKEQQIFLKDLRKCIGIFKDNLMSTQEESNIPKYLINGIEPDDLVKNDKIHNWEWEGWLIEINKFTRVHIQIFSLLTYKN